jgi:AcrR family transcriptional regulator
MPRPRSARADEAILETALRLLVEQGYDGMSMEAVAAAAGVGKPTIYRRYPSKRELVLAAVTRLAASLPPALDTGDVRVDLLAFLAPAFGVFQSGVGFAVLGTLLAREREDPALIELFRTRIIRPRMHLAGELLRRGIARSELRADAPVESVVQMLAGAIFARHVAGQPADSAWLHGLIDTLWRGLAATPSSATEP